MGKIEVNGPGADPLYQYLTANSTFRGFDSSDLGKLLDDMMSKADPDYKSKNDIKWNFTKFLISRDGEILERFEPTAPMDTVREKVEAAL